MKYSIFLLMICTSRLFAQSNCESRIDTLTKIRVYHADAAAMPEGGTLQFYKQIVEKLKFPRQHREDGCPKIMFAFIIDETGNAVGLRLLTKKYDGLENQLAEIIDGIAWLPAKCNGKKVATFLVMPIAIKCG